LFSVGDNYDGQIGDDTTVNCSTIKQIDYFKNIFIEDAVCGEGHCLAISNNGEIFAWGKNRFGQIGNGKSGDNCNQLTPIKIFKI
jgi:alpha-tubulin suppressor-like RCC1 family protein